MIRDLAALLACQLVGEVVARSLGLPIPGPVIGMALMAAILVGLSRSAEAHPSVGEGLESLGRTADKLLGALGLLFVPAGVGVVRHLDLVATYGLALGTALVGSVIVTLLVTVAVFRLTARAVGSVEAGDRTDG